MTCVSLPPQRARTDGVFRQREQPNSWRVYYATRTRTERYPLTVANHARRVCTVGCVDGKLVVYGFIAHANAERVVWHAMHAPNEASPGKVRVVSRPVRVSRGRTPPMCDRGKRARNTRHVSLSETPTLSGLMMRVIDGRFEINRRRQRGRVACRLFLYLSLSWTHRLTASIPHHPCNPKTVPRQSDAPPPHSPSADPAALARRAAAAHEAAVSRQSTVEFISSLINGVDTPESPIAQTFQGLPSGAREMQSLAEQIPAPRGDRGGGPSSANNGLRDLSRLNSRDEQNTLGPFLGEIIARNKRSRETFTGGGTVGTRTQLIDGRGLSPYRGVSPGANIAEALRRRARDIEEAERRDAAHRAARGDHRGAHAYAHGGHDGYHQYHTQGFSPTDPHGAAKRHRLRIHSAPEPTSAPVGLARHFMDAETRPLGAARPVTRALPPGDYPPGGIVGGAGGAASGQRPAVAADRVVVTSGLTEPGLPLETAPANAAPQPTTTATATTSPQPSSLTKPVKTKNPKRADRRRTIARFTTAILRAGGSNAFIARDGLGYRKAFDRFLVETYGETFAEGGYWYENARVEPFFRVLFHVATEGRVNLDHDTVNQLFCKREKRQAAEWLLDEEELSKFGVTATQLAQIFEGPPSLSPIGYPRGTPLAIPTDSELDSGAVPGKSAAAAVAAAAAAQAHMMRGTMPHGVGYTAQMNQAQAHVNITLHAGHGTRGYETKPPSEMHGDHGSMGPPSSANEREQNQHLQYRGHHGSQNNGNGVPPGWHPGNPGRPYDVAAAVAAAAGGTHGGYSHAQLQYAHALARQQQSSLYGHANQQSEPHHHGYHYMGPPGGSTYAGHGSSSGGHLEHGQGGHVSYAGGPGSMFPPVSLTPGSYGGGGMNGSHGSQQSLQNLPLMPSGGSNLSSDPSRMSSFPGYLDPIGTGPRRQYSSDLSRLMSEFNNNPNSSDDFLKSFIQRTASELDLMAHMGQQK